MENYSQLPNVFEFLLLLENDNKLVALKLFWNPSFIMPYFRYELLSLHIEMYCLTLLLVYFVHFTYYISAKDYKCQVLRTFLQLFCAAG